jgi:outer membrane receptor protein involved in Fe transport
LTTVPDGSTFTGIAVFAQDFWRITEQWSLLAGARYDHVAWDVPTVTTRAGYETFGNRDLEGNAEALTGNLRLAYQITDPWMTWTGVGQGFRTPTASDLAGTLDRASSSSGPGNGPQTKANPDLKPERSVTLEWGTRFKRDENTASFTVFRTELQDLITTRYIDVNGDGVISNLPPATNPDSAIRDNASRAYLQGGEVASDLGLPVYNTWRLSVFQTTSLVEGKARIPQPSGNDWQYISRANTLSGKFGLKLAEKGQWYGLTQVRWADGYDKTGPGDGNDVRMTVAGNASGQMPGWAVIDVKGGISDPKNAWRVDAGIENLGNITYRQVGSGTDGAGLNFVLSAEVRF